MRIPGFAVSRFPGFALNGSGFGDDSRVRLSTRTQPEEEEEREEEEEGGEEEEEEEEQYPSPSRR